MLVYDDKSGEICRYNIFFARMLVRHDAGGKKYLYDLSKIRIMKIVMYVCTKRLKKRAILC